MRSRRFVLESIADTFSNGRPLNESDFRNTASAVHDRFDGLLAVNWIDSDGRILWAEPFEPNEAAQGRRLDEHEFASPYYAAARESGGLTSTTPLELFQGGKGVAVYVPVNVEGEHVGMINGVFRAETLVKTALRGGLLKDYAARISDEGGVLWEADDFQEMNGDKWPIEAKIGAFDRTWTLQMAPRRGLVATFDRVNRLILIVGLVCAILVALLVYFVMARQRQRFESLRRDQLTARRLQEAQKFEALGRLARGVTHDFNNLLTAVNTGAQLIELDEKLSDDGRENLESIMIAAERAGQLTRQLMTFGQSHNVETSGTGRTNARDFAHRWERFVQKLVPAKVELDYAEAPDTFIAIDDSSMARILTNLIINAVDAMPDGGVLAVHWRVDEQAVEFSVSDDGTGMADEVLEQIFDPYFTTKSEDSGTGLGLPTVYDLVTEAGGAIEVDSKPGSGTTFKISIPLSD